MNITQAIILGILVFITIIFGILIKGWIVIYNKFQYWINKAKRTFADIDIIMQERIDKLHALAQMVKKYDIHEYKSIKDTIEARSGWSKDLPLNEKVKMASKVENNFFKLQAVFEKYPKLKADALHHRLITKGSDVERRIRKTRLYYNRVVQNYNMRLHQFPRNIVGLVHGFKDFDYLNFEGQELYKPKEIFD
jgi:LemA protein